MKETIMICENEMQVKEWDGKRVVTFADIDRVHERPAGTARKRFSDNRKHFKLNSDYYLIKPEDFRMSEKRTSGIDPTKLNNRGTILVTETGYLMLVKSFTDDLAWEVQRELVNTYFKTKELANRFRELSVSEETLNVMKECRDQIKKCASVFQQVADTSSIFQQITECLTINSRQQQIILQAGKDRVNYLLGGAHSVRYKEQSRMYFKNMWQEFGKRFQCGTYKDLNPAYMDDACEWISKWKYK